MDVNPFLLVRKEHKTIVLDLRYRRAHGNMVTSIFKQGKPLKIHKVHRLKTFLCPLGTRLTPILPV